MRMRWRVGARAGSYLRCIPNFTIMAAADDEDLLAGLGRDYRALVTIEDNAVAGGAGSAVAESLAAHGLRLPLLQLGIPDRFIGHGSREDCPAAACLDSHGLIARIEGWWSLHRAPCVRAAAGS
jgi:deoxyxylulose-5-phosphate synthase